LKERRFRAPLFCWGYVVIARLDPTKREGIRKTSRHCEERERRSNPPFTFLHGLLRSARNDEFLELPGIIAADVQPVARMSEAISGARA
jgi:hypothetical protein